ncbi:MAG: hypothetical protein QOD04_5718, partial [Pseudonocardiales bacterium]|nr:hypothetical protein [Pseudonocardiales bacterium]
MVLSLYDLFVAVALECQVMS